MGDSITIPMDDKTKRFYQGAATAAQVLAAHEATPFPDDDTRVKLFWFYVGVLAASEHGCATQEDFSFFVQGASTRAPQIRDEED